MNKSHFTIVGAGVAGLTFAHQLARQGHAVTVLERDEFVGGLGRTWHYGDYHFDVGPHRFHTDSPRTEAFIREVLGPAAIEIRRSSGARMFGRFHEWPLRPQVLASLPPSVMLKGARDLLARGRYEGESFEADILNKYGRTLYDIFFKPYTKKFLSYGGDELHRDWARAGVNRAVIDKRASADSLWSLLRTTLLPKPVDTTFLYTANGVGTYSTTLTDRIRAMGGTVQVGRKVTGLETAGGRIVAVHADGERIATDGVVWTGPITEATRLLGIPNLDLEFLSTLFFNLEVRAPLRVPYQWTYFGGDEVFSRVTGTTAFAPTMAPEGTSGLTAEITCREGDDRWHNPGALVDVVVKDLVRTGVVASERDISRAHVEPVRNTYPIYKLNYPAELARAFAALRPYSNLLLAGRCGRFWYNNMDHSIGQALTMADRVLRGETPAEIDEGERAYWETEAGSATSAEEPAQATPAASSSRGPHEPGT
jgi:protoporphyrinogen oxidase